MSRASGLYRLQEIDLENDRLKGRLEEIRNTLEDSAEITQLRADLAAKESTVASVGAAARRAENQVQDQRHKLKSSEQALYGGSVKNPKELEDLQMESDSLKRHLETLEDHYLEVMLDQDEAESARTQSLASLEAAEAGKASLHAELISERESINDRLASLQAEREVALASVSEQDQDTYEGLRTRLGGVAVVVLNGDSCGACGLTLSVSSRQLVGSADELIRCTQCGRILYGG
ncbi:MAG: zinc ribbon domain-containing protein [Anaerolineae bacterium]|nr:MAG: zinc ribbon domain-containing protein [Anaerolineae bacterium]